MRAPKKNLIGMRFGRTVVQAFSHFFRDRSCWACLCDCGNTHVAMAQSLKGGHTKSCGCLHTEIVSQKGRNARHGKTKTREHAAWVDMRRRCYSKTRPAFKNYGGRGITICQQWNSFEQFLDDMGTCPAGMELERIDVNGNYEPDNCRWATIQEQANNKRNNRIIPFGGQLMTVAEYAREIGIKYHTAYARFVIRGNAPHRSDLSIQED